MNEYREHILVIDDDPALLEQAEYILSERYAVSLANSGKQGVSFLEKGGRADIILLDIIMPDLDGFQTLDAIRSIDGCEKIPVIFLTSLSDAESELHGLRSGATDYITKPYNPLVLLARVELRLKTGNRLDEKKLAELAEPLTNVEHKVAILLARSYSNEEIAKELHYALDTVKKLVSRILEKLNIKSRKDIKKYLK